MLGGRARSTHEVFHAPVRRHAYPAHTHDAWTVSTVDEGSTKPGGDCSKASP